MDNGNGQKCKTCNTKIKIGREWGIGYYYCPKCREETNYYGEVTK